MAARRTRLRLRHDLLAAATGLEQRWCLATLARSPVRRAAGRREAQPVTSGRRLQPCAGTQGRRKTGRSPVDRGWPASEHHLITDADSVPLAVLLTGGNRNDVTQFFP